MLTGRAFALIASHIQRRFVAYLLVATLLLLGVIAGITSVHTVGDETRAEIVDVLADFVTSPLPFETPSSNEVLKQVLGGDLLRSGLLMWVLGLTVIGAPIILVMMFFRGFALGFTAGFLVDELAWRGVLLSIVSLVPHNLFAIAGLLMAGAAGLAFAAGAGRILIGKQGTQSVYNHFAASGSLVVLGGLLIGVGILVEAYVTPILIQTTISYIR